MLRIALAAASAACCLAGSAASAVEVDLELVLAVDVSRSVDHEEFELQREGYARALLSSAVLRAIQSGELGAIAVTYVEWSSAVQQKTVVDWTLISSSSTAERFVLDMTAAPRSFGSSTSISGAIDHAVKLFDNGFEGRRLVIDVSGDGSNNNGRPVTAARDQAVEAGVTINGLVIMNDKPTWRPEPKLDDYYREFVIGGAGAFVIAVDDFTSFGNAVLSKLIMEIAQGRVAPPRTLTAERD